MVEPKEIDIDDNDETAEVGFLSYPSIDNHYKKKKFLSLYINNTKMKWNCTEKIHGTNFSFVYDGENVSYAKRNSSLQLSDNFFNFQVVVNKYSNLVKNIFDSLKEKEFPTLTSLRIFGELYGGVYPDTQSLYSPIQKEVHYTPDIEFEAFDFYIEFKEKKDVTKGQFLDYTFGKKYAEKFNFPCAKILFEGNLKETLEFVNTLKIAEDKFESLIYEKYGLPKIPDNISEGVVLKCVDNTNRRVLKIKSKRFFEKNVDLSINIEKLSQVVTGIDLETCEILAEKYSTYNRFKNVITKLKTTERVPKNIKKLFLEDAYKDLVSEEPEEITKKISPVERGTIFKAMAVHCDKLIKNEFGE